MEFFSSFLSDHGFMLHGHFYLWNPDLVRLHIASDLLIAAAFFTIPFMLVNFVRPRNDLPFNGVFICFGFFAVACGLTNVMEIWNLWGPHYWISGAIKAVTALASVPTAILFIRLVPQALQIPGPAMLQDAKEELQKAESSAIRDATEHENLRKERAARLEAESENRAKDRFLAMLSHELRTPLTPVLATVELLDQQAKSSKTKSALALIRRNVELEARLIDDVLDLTAIAKGKLILHLESVDAHAVLRNAVHIFESEIRHKGLRTRFRLTASKHFVEADSSRLMQVFWNLIKNAIKFVPEGGEITLVSRNDNTDLVVEVIDNGSGIDPGLLPRVFNSFEQGERRLHEGLGGLGLGLAISKAIVDAHRGMLHAKSDGRDCGTTMTLRMQLAAKPPCSRSKSLPSGDDQVPVPAVASATPLRILLVDDHKDTVQVLMRLLTRLGYDVSSAESFQEALQLAAAKDFDLLVSDVGLPDGNGLDLLKQIRVRRPIDGIAISGFGMEDDLRKGREAGFVDYLIKPINLDRLQTAIRQVAVQKS